MITTRSNPSAFPSALRQKKTSLVQQRDVEKKKVYVDEDCEKCGNKQMSVKTMQLRSADEGGEQSTNRQRRTPLCHRPSRQELTTCLGSRSYCVLLVRAVRPPDPAQQLGLPDRRGWRRRGRLGGRQANEQASLCTALHSASLIML